jgi:hypothetical protein
MAEYTFPDPTLPFEERNKQLERRRQLARSLIEKGMTSGGQMVGDIYVAKNPWSNFVEGLAGSAMEHSAARDATALQQAEQQAARELVKRLGTPGTVEQTYDPATNPGTGPLINGTVPMTPEEESSRRLAVIGEGMAIPSLRQVLSQQLGQELSYPRQREQEAQRLASERARLEAQDKRQEKLFEQQMKVIDARIAGQKDLKQMPTIHITQGGASDGFGGAAPQIGIDPRTDAPIYRHTKSGKLFSYGPDGQPVAYEGAVAPKPGVVGQPTESERSSAGYLGRMEATEKNLSDAKPLPFPQQVGMDKAPGVTNYTLSPAQQVQRQQQEDWVRAKLRKESGAVIGEEEMAREIRTYFPMSGDSPEVIRQKAQSRAQALEQMRSSAGRAKPTEAKPVAAPARRKWNAAKGDFE